MNLDQGGNFAPDLKRRNFVKHERDERRIDANSIADEKPTHNEKRHFQEYRHDSAHNGKDIGNEKCQSPSSAGKEITCHGSQHRTERSASANNHVQEIVVLSGPDGRVVTHVGGVQDLADWVQDTERVAELERPQAESERIAPQKAGSVFPHLLVILFIKRQPKLTVNLRIN